MKTIFVSSTFRDMQAERDMLHLDVLPVLREHAREYGESIDFIDLRWGVNTGDMSEDAANRKVLQICLDNIDRAKPYMLVFLGDRYGWMPPSALLDDAAQEKGYLRKYLEESVTALEIEYGVLSQEEKERCIVCVREPLPYAEMEEISRRDYSAESLRHKEKLDTIKAELTERFGASVIRYHAQWDAKKCRPCGLNDLSQKLTERFMELLQKEWQAQSSQCWQKKELLQSQLFFKEKRRRFAGRKALLNQYTHAVLSPDCRLFLLKGEPGSGKSSVLSMLANTLEERGCIPVPFACANSTGSSTTEDFLKQAIWYLERLLETKTPFSIEESDPYRLLQHFSQTVAAYQQTDRPIVVFLLDAVDQLSDSPLLKKWGFLPTPSAIRIRFVLSAREDYPIPSLPAYVNHTTTARIPLLDNKEESREILSGILDSHHKGLDEVVWQHLLQKSAVRNPLYADMLLWRLVMMDADDLATAKDASALNQRMIFLIDNVPDTLPQLCAAVMQEAGKRFGAAQSHFLFSLLSASRYGLRESDFEAIAISQGIGWNRLDFARLVRFLGTQTIWRPDGRLDFSHLSIRQGFLSADPNAHHLILTQLCALPMGDPMKAAELLHHAAHCDDTAEAYTYLTHLMERHGTGIYGTEASPQIKKAAEELGAICFWKPAFIENLATPHGEIYILDFIRFLCFLSDVIYWEVGVWKRNMPLAARLQDAMQTNLQALTSLAETLPDAENYRPLLVQTELTIIRRQAGAAFEMGAFCTAGDYAERALEQQAALLPVTTQEKTLWLLEKLHLCLELQAVTIEAGRWKRYSELREMVEHIATELPDTEKENERFLTCIAQSEQNHGEILRLFGAYQMGLDCCHQALLTRVHLLRQATDAYHEVEAQWAQIGPLQTAIATLLDMERFGQAVGNRISEGLELVEWAEELSRHPEMHRTHIRLKLYMGIHQLITEQNASEQVDNLFAHLMQTEATKAQEENRGALTYISILLCGGLSKRVRKDHSAACALFSDCGDRALALLKTGLFSRKALSLWSSSRRWLALEQLAMGNENQAQATAMELLERWADNSRPYYPVSGFVDVLTMTLLLAELHTKQGNVHSAFELCKSGIQLFRFAKLTDTPALTWTVIQLTNHAATLLSASGDEKSAEEFYEYAQLCQSVLEDEHPNYRPPFM